MPSKNLLTNPIPDSQGRPSRNKLSFKVGFYLEGVCGYSNQTAVQTSCIAKNLEM